MLVLARKLGEKIVVNGNIEICVVELKKGVVRIGVAAPKSMPVHRAEVQAEIDAERLRPNPTFKPIPRERS